ncbi:MAG: hypothetical protein COU29_04120 [Candidatus Magasanikbacteria bacterium CG10_big_fil_rev_8_21_14_0_10_36_32]|uniref:Glycosyl transferase family 1 domain-containing protein n=1 Tax=Candidatus Magasanikbacteria bacterium CG10_big_fil_rev_8_21_14_0_10_36_32 TaxID=1974646 RepID=A0A2M6W5T9_9BACT|nr:MAG: hypothetical protein COU29_04120 [Candidatus Magasanikbacteria bacterium CG10_big_fil_rev_8_21_14_0_10_36_32]
MLVILTKTPEVSLNGIKDRLKSFIKFFIGKKRGPAAVTESLLRGLRELNYIYKYNVNAAEIEKDDTIYINESVATLKWAINAKKQGKIKRLITGPNITVAPDDQGGIMLDQNIDLILFPSQWTKNFWLLTNPELAEKIKIWPAGVVLPSKTDEEKKYFIVYQKNASDSLLKSIVENLIGQNIQFKMINYGNYKQEDYFKLLNGSRGMIYLSESESQGLALQEAWAHNVPTLVWNRGYVEQKQRRFEGKKISAPYLTEQAGMFFVGQADFNDTLEQFISKLVNFVPREYIMNNLTDKICAENFLKLINYENNPQN